MEKLEILKNIKNLFLQIDLFKLPLSFTIRNQSKIASTLGSLISFIILLLLLLFLILELNSVFGKNNPVLIREDLQYSKRPHITFNDKNFTFGLCLSDVFGRTYINDTVFRFESIVVIVKKVKSADGSQMFDVLKVKF